MSADRRIDPAEVAAFEEFYEANYKALIRYIMKILNSSGGSYRSLQERVLDISQETLLTAWARRDVLLSHPEPKRWKLTVAANKVKEALREENKWKKQLLSIAAPEPFSAERTFQLRAEMTDILQPEELDLLVWLYWDGYSYSEIAERLGVKKSALAMQVKRAKEKFQKNFEEINFQM